MKIYELLDTPEKWLKGYFAKNKDGEFVKPLDEEAVQFCIVGAVIKCYGTEGKYSEVINSIKNKLNLSCLITYNDKSSTSYEDIIKVAKELDV